VIDGGLAVVGATVYLPCLSGPVALQVSASPPGLHELWSASVGGGPPIVAAGLVWTIGADGVLYGLDPSSGAVRDQATIGPPANHFPTPSVGANLLLAPSADRVVAFAATTAAPTTTTRTAPVAAAGGGTNPGVIVGAAVAGLAVLAALTWFLRRRQARR
jgi:hypothetical protein